MPRTCTINAIVLLLTIAIAATTSAGTAEGVTTLREIKIISAAAQVQLEIVADKPLSFSAYTMPPLLRGIIDLKDTETGNIKRQQEINAGPVLSLSLQPKTLGDQRFTRITINLKRDMELNVVNNPMDKGKLLVTFVEKGAAPAKASTTKLSGKSQPQLTPVVSHGKTSSPASPPRVLQPVVPSKPVGRLVTGLRLSERGLDLQASHRLDDYNAFTLTAPGRLVIDLPQTKSAVSGVNLPINRYGVKLLRIGSYPDKLRLVFDANGKVFPSYEIVRRDKGLSIIFSGPGSAGKR